jgi:SNF2 family DNA or RNA helicase
VRGTVEERMLELQARKRAIASGIYGDREDEGPVFEAADLEHLFEPLG